MILGQNWVEVKRYILKGIEKLNYGYHVAIHMNGDLDAQRLPGFIGIWTPSALRLKE